jgi:hypothetical protein
MQHIENKFFLVTKNHFIQMYRKRRSSIGIPKTCSSSLFGPPTNQDNLVSNCLEFISPFLNLPFNDSFLNLNFDVFSLSHDDDLSGIVKFYFYRCYFLNFETKSNHKNYSSLLMTRSLFNLLSHYYRSILSNKFFLNTNLYPIL